MKKDVIYKVFLDERDNLGQFKKDIVMICDSENVFLEVAKLRKLNTDENIRYIVGHTK